MAQQADPSPDRRTPQHDPHLAPRLGSIISEQPAHQKVGGRDATEGLAVAFDKPHRLRQPVTHTNSAANDDGIIVLHLMHSRDGEIALARRTLEALA